MVCRFCIVKTAEVECLIGHSRGCTIGDSTITCMGAFQFSLGAFHFLLASFLDQNLNDVNLSQLLLSKALKANEGHKESNCKWTTHC